MACGFNFPTGRAAAGFSCFRTPNPDGFATSGEIVDFITAYAGFVEAPIRCGVA